MIVACPHCGANYPAEEEQFAEVSELRSECKKCHSHFIIKAPPDLPQLPAAHTVALAVVKGPARGQVFRLNKARIVLGRSGADVVLYDPEISRKHCAIEVRGMAATLIDLGTTNGTFVDGKKIQSCQLKHLSKFRIGATTLLFTVTDNQPDESKSPPTLVVRTRRG